MDVGVDVGVDVVAVGGVADAVVKGGAVAVVFTSLHLAARRTFSRGALRSRFGIGSKRTVRS
jgi:hypothetical protein